MKEKVSSLARDFRRYWNVPPQGRYMSFKEIASLSVGGIGVKFIVYCVNQMLIAVGNTLIGNTIGIDPSALYVIYLLGVLSGFPLTALRAKMIDNTRSMKGKYRPYLISMGIPTVVLGAAFIWMPYEHMTLFQKCAVVLLFNIGFQFFFKFFNDAYDSLINVLSPNSIERSDVLSIRSVVENFSPSIANIFLPLAAKAITGDNTLYDLRVFRALFPPMLLVGFLISLLVYVNTEEKIVQAKTHVISVKFSDAFRAIAHNKYFWIISLAGWLGFLENSFASILGWLYHYQHAATAAQYSIIIAIAGNASFWPNLVAPYFIRRYGKKKILIFTNMLNIGFILLMLPIVRMTGSGGIIWLLLLCTFVNQFITSLGHLLTPSVNADIRDYQQYITGDRIDGMFAAVGLIGEVITLASGFVLPLLYERSGLNQAVALSLGYDGSNVYDVLYDPGYFVRVSSVLVIASVVGAVMNVLPYFFYDLTETRQKAMVSVLKIRAVFEDYGNHVLRDEKLVEVVDIIREAKENAEKALVAIDRSAPKKAQKEQRAQNEQIEIGRLVMEELTKFDTPYGAQQAENAKRMADAGLNGFADACTLTRSAVKAMPKGTPAQREQRNEAAMQLSQMKASKKAIRRHYPNGLEPFDQSILDDLFKKEEENEFTLQKALQKLKEAKESRDRKAAAAEKEQVKQLHRTRQSLQRDIKKATNAYAFYYRAAKPYLDAGRLLTQKENYQHLDEVLSLYDTAIARIQTKE